MLKVGRRIDGRVILALIVVVFALVMLMVGKWNRQTVWDTLGAPAVVPEFIDARVVISGWECTERGLDVLVANPCDPLARPMNYPRVWTWPSFLGIGRGGTGLVVASFAAAAIAGLLTFAGRLDAPSTVVYLFALFSPASAFAFERGNTDLVIFSLVAFAVAAALRDRVGISGALVLVATVLKLFPIAAVGVVQSRRVRLGVLAASAVYFVVTLSDIRQIMFTTAREVGDGSYGLANLRDAVGMSPVAMSLAIAAVLVGVAWLARSGGSRGDRRSELGLLAGGPIYLATYAFGPIWDTRLIFLFLLLPLAIELAKRRRLELLVNVLAVLSLSWFSETTWVDYIDPLAQMALAAQLVVLLVARIPPGWWKGPWSVRRLLDGPEPAVRSESD